MNNSDLMPIWPMEMKNVTEYNVAVAPDRYEAFLYRYTNLKTIKIYVGIHKGFAGDGYSHSSKNEEFIRDLFNSSLKFKYEVLYYGDYKSMTVTENQMLTAVDAVNNGQYYNKSNGIPSFASIDEAKCDKIVDDIRAGVYNCETHEEISDLIKLPRLQPRAADDLLHQKEIQDRIDTAQSTDGCDPIVIFEKCWGESKEEDVTGGGNHTLGAAYKSQHARTLPTARIPKEISKTLSKAELEYIGLLLNPIPERVDKGNQVADGIKFSLNRISEGTPQDSVILKNLLRNMGFKGPKLGAITNGVKKEIDKKKNDFRAGYTFKNYDAVPRYKQELETLVEQTRDSTTSCISMSSGYFKIETIMETIYDVKNRKEVVVKLYHRSIKDKKVFEEDSLPKWSRLLEFFIKPLGYNVRIEPMEVWEKDVS